MDEWRTDFENAPKGGSQVQVFVPGYGQFVATSNGVEWWVGDREKVSILLPAEPTHWREPFQEPEQ